MRCNVTLVEDGGVRNVMIKDGSLLALIQMVVGAIETRATYRCRQIR